MDKSALKRCTILCLALVVGLSVLSFRLIFLQATDREEYARKAGNPYERTYPLLAKRGTIVDSKGEIIAESIISKTLKVDKSHLLDPLVVTRGIACQQLSSGSEWVKWDKKTRRKKILALSRKLLNETHGERWYVEKHLDYACSELARPLGMTAEELKKLININEKPLDISIAKDISSDLADQIKNLIKNKNIKGFRFDENMKRFYRSPTLLTHILGYEGKTAESDLKKGKSGIELAFEEHLAGRHGYSKEMRDLRGEVMPAYKGSILAPINGNNVQLTIEMGIQAIVDEQLDLAVLEFDPEMATIIVMNPKNGHILGFASRPHYNLNTRENIVKYGYNFGVQGQYEPGSTFKTMAVAAALNEGLKTIDSKVFCHNGYYREGKVWVRDDYPKEYLTVWGILQKSNNVGTYMLAKQVGYERYMKYVRDCGFGEKTGLSLGSESSGIVRDHKNPMDFSRNSFGYALDVTPLQIANFYCIIANGGKLMETRIVKKVEDYSGKTVVEYKPKMVRRVFTEKTCSKVREALEKVVQKGGTATRADVEGYTEGGKTGTAKMAENGGYSDTKKTVSFAGMLPIDNPEYVCVVVLQNPRAKKEYNLGGGTVAAPIWRETMKRVAAYKGLTPTEEIIEPVVNHR